MLLPATLERTLGFYLAAFY
ncbi:hypothetical protein LINPERPRIM_LOCUS37673 [Linum perenne]